LPSLLHDSDEEQEEEVEQVLEKGDRIFVAVLHSQKEINATQTVSQKLAEEEHKQDFTKRTVLSAGDRSACGRDVLHVKWRRTELQRHI
jgi:hypothetical protein